jgi:hypothetical protein
MYLATRNIVPTESRGSFGTKQLCDQGGRCHIRHLPDINQEDETARAFELSKGPRSGSSEALCDRRSILFDLVISHDSNKYHGLYFLPLLVVSNV